MIKYLPLLISILSTLAAVAGEAKCEAPRIFPFAMEGENLPELWSLTRIREGRNLLRPHGDREPAGTSGFLTAKGSNFVDESGRVRRFFGVNLYGPAALPEKADAPAMAERLARWGINAVRIFPQYTWQRRADQDFSKGIDPELLDRFDWLFFQLKQRGISADMNLHSARTAGYRFKDFKQTMKENKGLDNFDPTFILHQKEFIRTVFNHVNPYTGLAYRDDPAVMTWEINNECSLAIASASSATGCARSTARRSACARHGSSRHRWNRMSCRRKRGSTRRRSRGRTGIRKGTGTGKLQRIMRSIRRRAWCGSMPRRCASSRSSACR